MLVVCDWAGARLLLKMMTWTWCRPASAAAAGAAGEAGEAEAAAAAGHVAAEQAARPVELVAARTAAAVGTVKTAARVRVRRVWL